MILERIAVAGYRTFTDRIVFEPGARFTVIYAPNGTGKSTLVEALYSGLLERHTISGDGANKRFRSLGRDLTPTIEIDFSVSERHYRLRKVFLSSRKSATLQRRELGRYVAFKDGIAADDFVRELFCAVPSGAGVIKSNKHLGFHHVLFAPTNASFDDVPESVGDQIRSMLGGTALAVTDGERDVQLKTQKHYDHFFTSEGKFKAAAGTANVPALEEKLRLARDTEAAARKQYALLERLKVEHTDREAEAQRMAAVRDRLRVQIQAAKVDVDAFIALKEASERAGSLELQTRLEYEREAAQIRQLDALRSERYALLEASAASSTELDAHATAAATMLDRCHAARKAVEDGGAALAEVQRRSLDVTRAEQYVAACATVDRLQSTLNAYEDAAAKSAEIRAEQAQIVAPNRAQLESLRAATNESQMLQRTIAAAALSLDIEAKAAITVDVITGANVGPLTLIAGSVSTIAAAEDAVVVDIPGLGRVRARGTDGAAKARKQLRSLIIQLEAAEKKYGTSSIPELAGRSECAEELQRNFHQAQDAMSNALCGQAADDVRASLAEARMRVETFETEHLAWRAERPDARALRSAFDRDFQTATDGLRDAQIHLSAEEQPKVALDEQIAILQAANVELAVRLQTNATQLHGLQNDGRDDAGRLEDERTLALRWNAIRAEVRHLAATLGQFIDDPRLARDRLEEAEREAGVAYEEALGAAKTCHAQLEMQANLGSYARLAAAEESAAQLECDVAGRHAQAAAIKCLQKAFERVRAERVATVVGPITTASTHYLTRIAGSSIGEIDIGRGLAPDGLIEAASGLKLLIDGTLSSGEKEQIYLAVRLALAEVISKDRGRQLLVVDDAVTATDPNRLRRFIAILEELSQERLQIVVTTADRSRYLGIKGAKHFDLAGALSIQSAA